MNSRPAWPTHIRHQIPSASTDSKLNETQTGIVWSFTRRVVTSAKCARIYPELDIPIFTSIQHVVMTTSTYANLAFLTIGTEVSEGDADFDWPSTTPGNPPLRLNVLTEHAYIRASPVWAELRVLPNDKNKMQDLIHQAVLVSPRSDDIKRAAEALHIMRGWRGEKPGPAKITRDEARRWLLNAAIALATAGKKASYKTLADQLVIDEKTVGTRFTRAEWGIRDVAEHPKVLATRANS